MSLRGEIILLEIDEDIPIDKLEELMNTLNNTVKEFAKKYNEG